MLEPPARKALVIVIDAAEDAAQEKALAAFEPSASITVHAIEPGKVAPIRSILFAGPNGLPVGSRVGKGGRCAVCSSGRRAEIDRLLAEGLAPFAIARLVTPGASNDSIRRHARVCMVVKT
jgi:hypothetical protein